MHRVSVQSHRRAVHSDAAVERIAQRAPWEQGHGSGRSSHGTDNGGAGWGNSGEQPAATTSDRISTTHICTTASAFEMRLQPQPTETNRNEKQRPQPLSDPRGGHAFIHHFRFQQLQLHYFLISFLLVALLTFFHFLFPLRRPLRSLSWTGHAAPSVVCTTSVPLHCTALCRCTRPTRLSAWIILIALPLLRFARLQQRRPRRHHWELTSPTEADTAQRRETDRADHRLPPDHSARRCRRRHPPHVRSDALASMVPDGTPAAAHGSRGRAARGGTGAARTDAIAPAAATPARRQ